MKRKTLTSESKAFKAIVNAELDNVQNESMLSGPNHLKDELLQQDSQTKRPRVSETPKIDR